MCYNINMVGNKNTRTVRKKRVKKTKKDSVESDFKVNNKVIQSMAASAMAGLLPGQKTGLKLPDDFDLKYELIYAAAHQTVLKFQDNIGDFRSPIEMRISVKHDPDIERNELAYNFRLSKFIIYTPITDKELDKEFKEKHGSQSHSKADELSKSFGDILPGALLKYFTSQAEIMSQGQVQSYMKEYMLKQFNSDTDKRKINKKRFRKKRSKKITKKK